MLLRRELLRAYMTRTLAHGDREVVTRAYLSDGTIEEQRNPGLPDPDDVPWSPAGRYDDLAAERERLAREGWSIEPEDGTRRDR